MKTFFAGICVLALAGVLSAGMLAFSPSTGANGAETLRRLIGDQNVAALETVLFQAQDAVRQVEYRLGWLRPDDPFGPSAALPASGKGLGHLSLPQVKAPSASTLGFSTSGNSTAGEGVKKPAAGGQAVAGSARVQGSAGNLPPPVTVTNPQNGEGQWQPYLQDASGKTVAFRTFILPDPQRPYAPVAVVAFDLTTAQLHYVIGSQEPYGPGVGPKQPGLIPAADARPGALVAAFNGGFKFEHGHFGSMVDGFVSAVPRKGLGVVAIYRNHTIRIGEWGKDISSSPELVAFRQNGPLIIHDGAPTTQAEDESLWGRTIASGVYTWRSGLAISSDGSWLYYFAGPSISIRTLTQAMMAVHVANAMQLDINNYWVHFIGIQSQGGQLAVESLFPNVMREHVDRFLHAYPRDFFYVTANDQ